jgi:hypothetical protein
MDKRTNNTTAQRKWIKGQTIQQPKEKGQKDKQYNSPKKMDKRTNNTTALVCPFVLFLWALVLFVLLSIFFGLLYCLSFYPFSLDCCIVCPFVLFLNSPKKKDKRTNNTTAQRKSTKGQTIQQPIEKGQKDKQYNSPKKKDKRTNNTTYCLSFCPFSLGCCIFYRFIHFLWAVVLLAIQQPKEKGQKEKQYNSPKKKDKRTNNTTAQRKRTKGQTIQQPKEKGRLSF